MATPSLSSTSSSCRQIWIWTKAEILAGPNILLLMTDQQRADALGASGGWVPTPNLDRLAAEGMRFANCVTTSPVCVPARLSLATGLYPHHTGVWQNQRSQPSPDQPTWMQRVRAAGYRTALFGKTHLYGTVPEFGARGNSKGGPSHNESKTHNIP